MQKEKAMIFDSIKNKELYIANNESFNKAFEFIKRAVEQDLPAGKYEIDGNEIYASVQEYTTKNPEEGLFEGHKKYIDVQYVISGVEQIYVVDVSKTETAKEYDEKIDAAFFTCRDEYCNAVLEAGDFCIFYPHDIHKPGLSFGKNSSVKKIVVKIAI